MQRQRPQWKRAALAALALALGLGTAQAAGHARQPGAHQPSATASEAAKQAEAQRARITEEAMTALARTREALAALGAHAPKRALDLLAEAVGKLEVLTSAHPELALAPADVRVIVRDFPGDVKAIRAAVEKAGDLLDDGKVQDARHLLEPLASEIDVQVASLPLATYPQAIKQAVRLIAKGKNAEAAAVLQEALNTLVIVDYITPLPVIHAQEILASARKVVGKKRRLDAKQTGRVQKLLASARHELERARALGYIGEDDYEAMLDNVKSIEAKLEKRGDTRGLLDRLRRKVDEILGRFGTSKS